MMLVLMMCGCGGGAVTDRALDAAAEVMNVRPDSAEAIVKGLDSGRMTRGQQARRTRLVMESRYRQGKTFMLEEGTEEAIEYYRATNDTAALIGMYRLAAIGSSQKGEKDRAASYLEKAISAAGESNAPTKTELLVSLANLHAYPTMPKDYRKAIEYSLEAARESHNSRLRSRALHDAGIFHAFLDEPDSATAYLDRAMRATTPDDPEYDTYALNYANNAAADIEKGIAYLDRIKGRSLGRLITKGFVYLNSHMTDSAASYLRQSKKLYQENPQRFSINTYNGLRMLEECVNYAVNGKVDPARGTVTNDSISELISIERRYEAELAERNSQLQINLLESRTRTQRAILAALGIIIAGLLTAGAIYRRNKLKYLRLRKELDKMRMDQIMAEAEQEQAQTPMEIIGKRSELCIERFRETGLLATIQQAETLMQTKSAYLPLKDRNKLRDAILECFADFIIDVRIDAGKLSIDDLLTCVFALMRLTNTAAAACMGASEGAIRTRKSRLKGKLSAEMGKLIFG